jgi:lycopene cyclase domain-containing protein
MALGHLTYPLLALGVLLSTLLLDVALGTHLWKRRSTWLLALTLCALTLLFDNLLVGLDIVRYDPSRILGLRLGFAPIEDFSYAIAAAFLPHLWRSRSKRS